MENSGELKQLLGELVAIDSTSTRSNQPIVEFLQERLVGCGFRCEQLPYTDELGCRKINLIAVKGPDAIPELALVGHTDCVPFDSAWSEALKLTERGGHLFGRGACDTKAFIAAALTAVRSSIDAKLQRPLEIIFTADEELGCFGAKKLVEIRRGSARYAIVGEPTSLFPIRANKGYCLAEIEVLGKEGHSAYPDSGSSAIVAAADFIYRLEAWATTELQTMVDAPFDPPFSTVNVGVIQGGKAKNVIPGRCVFSVEWRPIPSQPIEVVRDAMDRFAREIEICRAGISIAIRELRRDRGAEVPSDSTLVEFLVRQTGKPAGTIAFGTEAPQMQALGAEPVVFGPGNIQVAHRTGEFVPFDELIQCERILQAAIRHFCVETSA